MWKLVAFAAALLLAAPGAIAQQRTSDEDDPRRTAPRSVDRPVTMERPAPETDGEAAAAPQETRQFQTISNAAFDARVANGAIDREGRWGCGCPGVDNGRCRAFFSGRTLTCEPAEEEGCETRCELSATFDGVMSTPARRAGD